MNKPVTVIGTYLSPYVRKVLVTLHLKGIPYEIDPIIPFFGDDRFTAASPLRRIPVLIDDEVTVCDSSVICQYLEDRYPAVAIFPKSIADRARARWLEEYADSHMGDIFIWRLFNQVAITPFVWGKPTDQEILQKTLTIDIPGVLNFLEAELPPQGFLFGDLSIADISIASFFRNAKFSRYTVDAAQWPRTAAFVDRVLTLDCFTHLQAFEDKLTRTKIPEHRATLTSLGAPLTPDSFGTATPRRSYRKD
jgi:glutathione S-transferase